MVISTVTRNTSSTGLREAWKRRYKDLSLSNGIRAYYSFQIPGLSEAVMLREATFPYNRSLKALIQSLDWSRGFVPTANHDYPKDKSPGWTDKLQGVTHDLDHWYFAQQDRLRKVHVTHDLNQAINGWVGIPLEGYNHFGDIDFYEGLIYAPLEGHHENFQLPAVVAIFDQNLQCKGAARLTAQGASGPWCAVNPLNGLLYSSVFNDAPDRIRLQVYQRSFDPRFELKYVGTMDLFDEVGQPLILGGLQGAAFSKQGHFYLVVDTVPTSADDPTHRGIMGFDMITGRRIVHIPVDYRPWKHFPVGGWVKIQELEGITIWEDVGAAGGPGITGQLHLIMLDKDWESDDDLYFKHYKVADSGDLTKV
ncbi:hypothetical protein H6F89_29155 [Cyanobacteria bacterium FACHB-63]|nr:hypothetical protein [Cyanobacteria bacterium FACHB-63]